MPATLYLIPVPISTNADSISDEVKRSIADLRYFVVENIKTARRMLRKMNFKANFDLEVQFIEWDKHSKSQNMKPIENWILEGYDIGLMSEAGLPCIADPGHLVVAMAHRLGAVVKPLSGPSSIFLALMASGLAGQNFAFYGYIPIDKAERVKKIRQMESLAHIQTQIFMETPYRNQELLRLLLQTLSPNTYLSVACNLTALDESITTDTVHNWKKKQMIHIHKKPCIFVVGNAD